MGTSLSGTQIKTSYVGLLKAQDNAAIGSSLKTISDGTGNDTALSVSTSQVKVTNLLIGSPSVDTNSNSVLVRDSSTGVIGVRTLPTFLSVTTSLTSGADPVLTITDAAGNSRAVTFSGDTNVQVSASGDTITFKATELARDFVDTTQTFASTDSGKKIIVDAATNTGQTYTLPDASRGLVFDFFINVSSTTEFNINAGTGDYFYGAVEVFGSGNNKSSSQVVSKATAAASPSSYNQLSFDSDASNTGGLEGSHILCIGDTGGWMVSTTLFTSDASPSSIATINAQ